MRKTKKTSRIQRKSIESVQRHNDVIVRTKTTTETTSAIVDYADILDSVRVEPDEYGDAPWESCDGWEHIIRKPDDYNTDWPEEMQGYVDSRRVIELGPELYPGNLFSGYYGASKQVRAELLAMSKRDAIAQLVKWYSDGWEYYGVACEFLGVNESVWGIDSFDYADEMRDEIAGQVCAELKRQGFTVVNRPAPKRLRANGRSMSVDTWRDQFKRGMESQNWK